MPEAFGLYLILTDPAAGYERTAEAAVDAGVRYLQLRVKKAPRADVVRIARSLRAITRGTGTLFIVNDYVDVAAEVGADGVHLGQDDMPLDEARRLWPSDSAIFGLSTHNETQADRAFALRPSYMGVGPVYPTPAKEHPDPVLGPERAGRIAASSPLTAVAIGGINRDNLREVLRHGAANFAVVRAVNESPDPRAAIRELTSIWRDFRAPV